MEQVHMWCGFLNHCKTAAKFRSVFNEFPFFNYVQSKALDDVRLRLDKHIITLKHLGVVAMDFYYLYAGPLYRKKLCGVCSDWIW